MAVAKEKRMSAMAPIYGNLIVKGERAFSEVPAAVKEDVRKWLADNGHEELAADE